MRYKFFKLQNTLPKSRNYKLKVDLTTIFNNSRFHHGLFVVHYDDFALFRGKFIICNHYAFTW